MLARLEKAPTAAPAPESSSRTAPRTEFAPAPAAPSVASSEPDDLPADESLFAGVTTAEVSTASTVASVLAAAAGGVNSSDHSAKKSADDGVAARLVPDTRVVPPRPEPFMPRLRPDFPEDAPRAAVGMDGIVGAAAVAHAAADPAEAKPHIERDPSVNKSLLLRLIAGVRGL
jgi:hypothetical protein